MTQPEEKFEYQVLRDLNALEDKIDLILAKMEKVEEMTATVIEQVKPAIDDLMNSSLGKMLGIKKGK